MIDPDSDFERFLAAYPAGRRQRGYLTQQAFMAALGKTTLDVLLTAAAGLHKLEPQYVPLMSKFLQEDRWIQQPAGATPRPPERMTPWERLRAINLDGLGRPRKPDWTCRCGAVNSWWLKVCDCGQARGGGTEEGR